MGAWLFDIKLWTKMLVLSLFRWWQMQVLGSLGYFFGGVFLSACRVHTNNFGTLTFEFMSQGLAFGAECSVISRDCWIWDGWDRHGGT